MTKSAPPKKQPPWPAFTLVAASLVATALVSAVLLDWIGARRGERAYLFSAAPKGPVPAVGP